jgi:uncharacterized protein (DUF58 family)
MANKAVSDTATQTAAAVQIQLRLRLPLLWLAILLLAAIVLPDRVWNTLLVGIGGLFIVAYVWAREMARGLHATRRLRYGWVSVGDRLEETFSLVNRSELPALWVEVVDESNVPGYRAAVVRSVGAHQHDRWRQTAVCTRRGLFHLGPWSLRSSDPFGIFSVTRHYPTTREVIIHPPIHSQLTIPLPVGQSSGRARAQQRAWQATINAAAVRGYQPHDPLHWIHWRTSARQGALFVREFDLDATGDVWLVLDMQTAVQLGQETHSTEEHAVLLAAALAARAAQQNRAVGLAAYGRTPQITPPARGAGQRWKILRALALVNADGAADLGRALEDLHSIARRGAAAVIITPNGTADWLPQLVTLARRGVQANLILLDRPSFGGAGNSAALRDAVWRLGFAAHVVRREDLGQPLEAQARRGFWEFKVTGLGKVVTVRDPLRGEGTG